MRAFQGELGCQDEEMKTICKATGYRLPNEQSRTDSISELARKQWLAI
jgi:hypothetical protein